MKNIQLIIILLLIGLLSGCSSAPTSYAPNFNPVFLKKYPVSGGDIKVSNKINIQSHNNLLIVAFNTDQNDSPTRQNMKLFFIDAIKNMHIFKNVILIDNVSEFLNQHGQSKLAALDYNYSINVSRLASSYPGVLLANFYTEDFLKKSFGSRYSELTVEIMDPTTNKVYLKIQYAKNSKHTNKFYYSAVNDIKKWATKN